MNSISSSTNLINNLDFFSVFGEIEGGIYELCLSQPQEGI